MPGSRLQSIVSEIFDLVVVGGGIIGAGIARDAALRGLKVALFEKSDFASGTTAGSTRLIHGGLRYLAQHDFRLVRQDLREREILLAMAPHLVHPLSFLIPFYSGKGFSRFKLRLGLRLYDLLGYDCTLPEHTLLNSTRVQAVEPQLSPAGLQGGALYYDAQVDSPERLCLENILSAGQHGARTFNYVEVTGARSSGGALAGVTVRDCLSGGRQEVPARVVVNATGPWCDRIRERFLDDPEPVVRTTKGIHLACTLQTQHALVLFSPLDGRLFFTLPWLGHSWIGTTDTDFTGDPRRARASGSEAAYLLASLRPYLPHLAGRHIFYSNSGVRALLRQQGPESRVTRSHRVLDESRNGAEGLFSVVGGKITGYRAIAEEVTDLVCDRLGRSSRCRTAFTPLPGASPKAAAEPGIALPEPISIHLAALYGSRRRDVLEVAGSDPQGLHLLAPAYPDIVAQVIFSIRREFCCHLTDFFLRRSLLAFQNDQGRAAIEPVAACMARELGWSAATRAAEVRAYHKRLECSQTFRRELFRREDEIPLAENRPGP